MSASGTQVEGKVWLDGFFRGPCKLYPIRDHHPSLRDSHVVVSIDGEPFVARRNGTSGSDFKVVFSLQSLDAAIGELRHAFFATKTGPVTIRMFPDSGP
jgi:hypothetical protein